MKTMIIFLALSCLALLAKGDCTAGTLKCNTAADPVLAEICDTRSKYVLNATSGKCEEKTVEGCEIVGLDEATQPCFLCKAGKVLDVDRLKCVDVAADLVKTNCARYSRDNSLCEECEAEFFLQDAECKTVTAKVTSCLTYSSAVDCFKCKSRFRLMANECVPFVPVLACKLQSNRICDKCSAGFQLASRVPEQEFPTIDYLKSLVQADRNQNWWLSHQTELPFCVKEEVPNCKTFKNATNCEVCDVGYFLNSSLQCTLNPYKSMHNCAVYTDRDTCFKCVSGFFLGGNPISCMPATTLANCKEYEVANDKCRECTSAYYWSNATSLCVDRTVTNVVQCKAYSLTADVCEGCNDNFSFTNDNLKCLADIANCASQTQAATLNDSAHTCATCDPNHVYLAGQCQSGNIDFCVVYKPGEMKCQQCQATHYVVADACQIRTTANCKTFVGDDSNLCQICNANFYEDSGACTLHSLPNCVDYAENLNHCVTCNLGYYEDSNACTLQSVANCWEYVVNQNSCAKCSMGYYMTGAGACDAVSETHCKTYNVNTNICTSCSLGYYLNNGSCLAQNQSKCIEYTINTNNCSKCQEGTYMSSPNVCSVQSLPQCIEYTINTNTCTKCQAGYWLDQTTCVQQNVVNCLTHTTNAGTCATCATGYYLSTPITCIKLDVPKCIDYNPTTFECSKCAANTYLAFGSCLDQSVVNCIDYTSGSNTCAKCASGYFLNSTDNICVRYSGLNCIDFDSNGVCTTCASGFLLNGSKHCVFIFVDRCIEYAADGTCTSCEKNTWFDGAICRPFNKDNCVQYNLADGNCTTCAVNYYITSGTCTAKSVDGCIEYDTGNATTCKTCADTHLKISGVSCLFLDYSNCTSMDGSGVCNGCGLGYYLDTTCKPQYVENCIAYTAGSNTCSKCAYGYYFNTPNCVKLEKPFCIDFEPNSLVCKTCRAGYYLDGSKNCILPFVTDCILYVANSGDCSKCMAGYFLADASTCTIQNGVDKCIKYTPNTATCEKCQAGYSYSGGICNVFNVAKCIKYNTTGGCTECTGGYHLVDASTCTKQEGVANCIEYTGLVCSKCAMLYYLETPTKCSVPNVAGCVEYNNYTNECKYCQRLMYKVDNSTCAPANIPDCVHTGLHTNNCSYFAKGRYWLSSTTSAIMNSTKCIYHVFNSNNCYDCQRGYRTSSGSCIPQSQSNCIQFDFDSEDCNQCAATYNLNGSQNCYQRNNTNYCIQYDEYHVCTQCRAGFYLEGSDDECYNQSSNGCLVFDDRSSISCKTLRPDWMFGANSTTYKLVEHVDNCAKTNYSDQTQCAVCINGFHLATGACTLTTDPFIEFCLEYPQTTTTAKCEICIYGYWWDDDNTVCALQDVANCKVHRTNVNECSQCIQSKYSSDNGVSCGETKSITYCAEYSSNSGDEYCLRCNNKYYLYDNQDCDRIYTDSYSNCYSSAGYSDKCDVCTGSSDLGYQCKDDKTDFNKDPNCTRANNVGNNPDCVLCSGNYTVTGMTNMSRSEGWMTFSNCEEVDHTSGFCSKCKPWHIVKDDEGDIRCHAFEIFLDSKCAQWLPGTLATMTENFDCLVCSDEKKFYNDGGKCKTRKQYEYLPNCKSYYDDRLECKECNDSFLVVDSKGFMQCVDPNTVGTIPGCAYFLNLTKCYKCEPDKQLSGDKTTCTTIDPSALAFSLRRFNRNMGTMEPVIEASLAIPNCAIYSQVFEEDLGCTRCADGFVGIVADPNSYGMKKYGYTLANKNSVGFDDVVNTFLKCLPDNQQYLKSDDTKSVLSAYCAIGFQSQNTGDGYACLRCEDGMLGRIGLVAKKPDGSAISPGPIRAVVDCSNEDVEMTMVNSGMFFTNPNQMGMELVRSSYFQYDTCPSGKRLVYSFITSVGFTKIEFPTSQQQDSKDLRVAYCLDDAKVPEVAGCQFYSIRMDYIDTNKLTDSNVLRNSICAMCKPGYMRTDDNECMDMTAKCDDPAPFKPFLGGCRKNKNPVAIYSSDQMMFSEREVTTGQEPECLIQMAGTSQCMYCNHGFWNDAGACKIRIEKSHCLAAWGVGIAVSAWFNTAENSMKNFANIVWRFHDVPSLITNDIDHSHSGCLKCAKDTVMNWDDQTTFYQCLPTSGNTEANTLTGCDKIQIGDTDKCAKCSSGFILNPSTELCISNTPFLNCMEPNAAGDKCAKCEPGYILDDAPACVNAYCEEMDPSNPNVCLVCKDNLPALTGAQLICDNANDNGGAGDCQRFSPGLLGRCVKCRDPTKWPYNKLKRTTDSDLFVLDSYTCKTETLERKNYSTAEFPEEVDDREYEFAYLYFDSMMTVETSVVTDKTVHVMTASAILRYYDMGWGSKDAFCFLKNDEADCADKGVSYCRKCNNGFVLKDDGTCEATTITDCKVLLLVSGAQVCLECDSEFFMPDNTTCTARIISVNAQCTEKSVTTDVCTACPERNMYISATGCTNHTMICHEYDITADQCAVCDGGKYMTGGSCTARNPLYITNCVTPDPLSETKCQTCKPLMVPNASTGICENGVYAFCLTLNAAGDACDDCGRNMKKNDADPTNCVPKTQANCKEFTNNSLEDLCESCETGYFLISGQCKERDGVNCLTFPDSTDPATISHCATCSEYYIFKNEDKTCMKKTAPLCRNFHPTEDKCLSCSRDMYIIDGVCYPKPISTCESFEDNNDVAKKNRCSNCKSDYKLVDGACIRKTTPNCKLYTNNVSEDKCLSCEKHYKLENGQCIKKDPSMCEYINSTTTEEGNKCSSCAPIFWMDGNNCARIDVDGCKTYSQTHGRCASCSDDNFLDADTAFCIQNNAQLCDGFKAGTLECNACEDNFDFDFKGQSCVQKITKNCATYSTTEDKCATCSAISMFDGTDRSCRIKNASNCLSFKTSTNECEDCSPLFRMDSAGNCIQRVSKNCKSYVATNDDKCADCEDGFQLNAVTGQCNANRGKNCLTFRTDKHGCATCSTRHYINGLDECVPNDQPNCLKNLEPEPGCQTCAPDYYKLGKMCMPKTRTGCAAFAAADTDECLACDNGLKFDAYKNCRLRSASLCETLSTTTTDECAACKAGFYKNGENCLSNSSQNCLTYTIGANTCATCSASFYSDGTNCLLKTASLCDGFHATLNKCNQCEANFLLDGSSINCIPKTATMCNSFNSSVDKCEDCGPLSYNDGTNCERDDVANCATYNPSASGCQTCGVEFNGSGSSCTKNNSTGCLTFKDNVNECDTCHADYVLNAGTKNCDLNPGTLCSTFTTNANGCATCENGTVISGTNCVANNAQNCSAFNATLNECTTCSSMSVWNNSTKICAANSALNCQEFEALSDKCTDCSQGFYKNGSNDCVKLTAVGCALNISQQNECDTCRSGFWKNGSLCVASSLDNCEQYVAGQNQCSVCKMGFYPKDVSGTMQCVTVDAPNCATIRKNKNECLSCVPGVALVSSVTKLECVTYTAVNCATYQPANNACQTCTASAFMMAVPDDFSKCSKRSVTDCVKFEPSLDKCAECAANKYLDSNQNCQGHAEVSNCLKYSPSDNFCLTCNVGYYRHATLNQCDANPEGIGGCVKYTDSTNCQECNSTSYLSENKCLTITQPIVQCEVFTDATSCGRCFSGFMLVDNACPIIDVQYCAEISGPTTCATCLPNYLHDKVTNQCVNSNIANCIQPKYTETTTICEKCKAGYFLGQNQLKCDPPSKPVLGCAEYEDGFDQLLCKNCLDKMVLSVDKKECTGVNDLNIPKCERGFLSPQNLCETCHYGYLRDDKGQCIKLKDNCALKEASTGLCLLCLPGTNMGSDGKCVGTPTDADPEAIPDGTGGTTDTGTDGTRTSVVIRSLHSLVLFAMILFTSRVK